MEPHDNYSSFKERAIPGPVTLAHKPVIDRMLASYPPEISEHTFTNFFVWRRSHDVRIAEAGGAIVVYEVCHAVAVIVGPPIGEIPLADALRVVEASSGCRVVALLRLPERSIAGLPAAWTAEEDRDNFDYVYRTVDLAELAGRNYHAKRNLITQCLAEHDCRFEEITTTNLPEVRDMMTRWCQSRDCRQEPGLCQEYQAVQELFDHFPDLKLLGGAVRVDGKIEAFSAGERLNPSTAVVHFEKAMLEIKGLYQVINQWFCRHCLAGFEFVNREQDLGLEGLRKAKESYLPEHLGRKFALYPLGKEAAAGLPSCREQRCPE